MRRLLTLLIAALIFTSSCGGEEALPDITDGSLEVERSANLAYIDEDDRFANGRVNVDVFAPTTGDDWPVVVMFHGNGGSKSDLRDEAERIAERGRVVFVPQWQREGPGMQPADAADAEGTQRVLDLYASEVACAVAYARAEAPAYGGDADHLTTFGWSAGGNAAVMAALADPDPVDSCTAAAAGGVQAVVILDGALLLASDYWDGFMEADPETIYHFTPWRHLEGNEDIPIHILVTEMPGLGVDLEAVATRHPDIDLRGEMMDAGFGDDEYVWLYEIGEWAFQTFQAAGYETTFGMLMDSTHGGWSRDGKQLIVDTVVGAEG
jgi:pimeloyl-ACP methyl ester carboxylesterase